MLSVQLAVVVMIAVGSWSGQVYVGHGRVNKFHFVETVVW